VLTIFNTKKDFSVLLEYFIQINILRNNFNIREIVFKDVLLKYFHMFVLSEKYFVTLISSINPLYKYSLALIF